MTVALGLGQYDDIHPKSKKALGERLEKEALYSAYGLVSRKIAEGPSFKNCIPRMNELVLYFDNAEDGFIYMEDSERLEHYKYLEARQGNKVPENLTGFEVAGEDGNFYPALVRFEEGGIIVLSSPDVPRPLHARYAWYNYGPVTVYGRNGLPLAPFSS